MRPWAKRVLFYGGLLVLVTLMCQDVFRRACLAVLGDEAGESFFSFVRTNVEAPITIIFVALYLDVVLRGRGRPADVAPTDAR